MDEGNGQAVTKTLQSPGQKIAFDSELPGCGTCVVIFRHHCHPNVALLHPGVDMVGAEETEGMAAEDVWEEVEGSHIELDVSAGEYRPLDQIWCPENPSCIVPLRMSVIKCRRSLLV